MRKEDSVKLISAEGFEFVIHKDAAMVYTYRINKDVIVAQEDHGVPCIHAVDWNSPLHVNLHRISLWLVRIRERTYKSIAFLSRKPTPFPILHFYMNI
uniref:Uncharacterized protein n=1 Tax=Salix viminalis TaxID=40686 RepID=A0A6N2L288_SALVM